MELKNLIKGITIASLVAVSTACSGGGGVATSERDTDETSPGWQSWEVTTSLAPTTTVSPDPVITGSFTLIDSGVRGEWDACYGTKGYDDFGPGMTVTIRDGDGSIVGVGSTESLTEDDRIGMWADDVEFSEGAKVSCVVKFSVEVKLAEFYAVEVGSRGDISYSMDELETSGWHVELSLD